MQLLRVVVAFSVLIGLFMVIPIMLGQPHVAIGVAAGALTGLGETLLMFPFENVKTQQQLHRGSLADVIRRTSRNHGYRGFYRGILPVLVGAIPSQSVRWGTFTAYCGQGGCASMWDTFVAALIAGTVVSVLIGVPMETMKTEAIHRLHDPADVRSKRQESDEAAAALVNLRREDGVVGASPLAGLGGTARRGFIAVGKQPLAAPVLATADSLMSPTSPVGTVITFDQLEGEASEPPIAFTHPNASSKVCFKEGAWKGWLPTVLKKVVNQAVRFPAHRSCLLLLCVTFVDARHLNHLGECKASNHMMLSFVAGALAGLSSIAVTQPIDVVKTRMQGLQGHRYRHCLHCMVTIIKDEGCGVLCDGIAARSLRAALGAALTFSVFPQVQSMLHRWWQVKEG